MNGSSRVAVNRSRCRGVTPGTEAPIAVQIERQSLEEPPDISQSIAAPLEHFQLGVQPFNKTTTFVVDKVIRDAVEPGIKQLEERVETRQATALNPRPPQTNPAQAIGF